MLINTKVVGIGGGTGLPVVLKGLKKYLCSHDNDSCGNSLTAIVTVTDDGGSSGRLKRDLNILPPGDIRNCLVALADGDSILPGLFQYRFTKGRGLNNHSMGNLILAALSELTKDFEYAINATARLLGITGRVLPSTSERVEIGAKLRDGRIVWGQTAITKDGNAITKVFLKPENPSPVPLALRAIASADAIIIGPGSLYTSLIPNLLVPGIVEAISESPAKKILVMNLMTQPGETDGYTAEDHLDAIRRHCGKPVFNYVILNNKRLESRHVREHQTTGCMPVAYDITRIVENNGIIPIRVDVSSQTDRTYHDPDKLAQTILNIIRKKDSKAKLKTGGPQILSLKPPSHRASAIGRIPINADLSEVCINCLWLEQDNKKRGCANQGTTVCPLYRKEILKGL